jgi:hypothetical protein
VRFGMLSKERVSAEAVTCRRQIRWPEARSHRSRAARLRRRRGMALSPNAPLVDQLAGLGIGARRFSKKTARGDRAEVCQLGALILAANGRFTPRRREPRLPRRAQVSSSAQRLAAPNRSTHRPFRLVP